MVNSIRYIEADIVLGRKRVIFLHVVSLLMGMAQKKKRKKKKEEANLEIHTNLASKTTRVNVLASIKLTRIKLKRTSNMTDFD